MIIDIAAEVGAITRTVGRRQDENGVEVVTVVAARSYDASPEDVWAALTDPERIPRWFMPVSGDLREGGHFRLEGNASGDILTCTPPDLLRVTFGDQTSIVELRLSSQGSRTVLELEHTVPLAMAQSGAGALWVGPGWDGALLGLGLFLAGTVTGDPVAAASAPETQAFSKSSAHAWGRAVEDSGTATVEQLAEALQVSLAQFAPDVPAEG